MRKSLRCVWGMAACMGLLAVVLPCGAWSAPDSDNPHVWKPATKSVAVFKNGFGYFTREGAVQLREGWCVTGDMPSASYGTFAVYSLDEGAVVDVVGAGPGEEVAFDGVDAPDTPEARRARLEANQGLNVALNYTAKGNDRMASGEIVSLGDTHVVLEDGENSFAVPIAGISVMRLLDYPVRVHVEGLEDRAQSTLGMGYLSGGIQWVPEYTLRVLDDETAELTLRGTLVNDAEDLIDCDVHFVVGAPNFAHAGQLTPLAARRLMRAVAASVPVEGNLSQMMSNGFANIQWVGEQGSGQAPFVEAPPTMSLPELDGPAATDYTVYTKEGLTVRKGESAAVTLFVTRIQYGHMYRWTPPGEIRHFLRLEHGEGTAWTTGPCLAVSGDRPLSEDMLHYTPKGATAEFPVTAAINISHGQQEREADREFKAYSISEDKSLDLVALEGTLSIANYEQKPVTIAVNLPIAGKPVAASDEGKMRLHTDALSLSERRGSIAWRIEVEPGATRELTYRYERYVESK